MFKKSITIIAASMILVGCAARVPMASEEEDEAIKTFAAKADVAGLYIYRNESMGKLFRMDVELDGKPLGQIGSGTFFYLEVAPGRHTVTSHAENTSEVTFDAVAGKPLYIWNEVKMGLLKPRVQLQVVDSDKGKAGVADSYLIKQPK